MIANELDRADDVTIAVYSHDIASFVENELAESYEMLQSSLPFFKIFRSLENAGCYIARHADRPSTILLFTCRNRRVDVLNEMIEIDQTELRRFAAGIFGKFERVDVIAFKALKTTVSNFGFPVQQYASKGTYLISLPGTPEAYTSNIGKSTRANIRQQTNGLVRNFPSFASVFFENEHITDDHIRTIIGFSEKKINAKGAGFRHEVDRITRLARLCGFVNIFVIDGRICAGSINYVIGSSYFGEVTGYDPEYEKYGLGKLCVHQTICESIVRGGKRFYLGGGTFDFKQRLLGNVVSMDEVHIYRSRLRMLVCADIAAQAVAVAALRNLKRMVQRRRQEKWAKLIFTATYFLRSRLGK